MIPSSAKKSSTITGENPSIARLFYLELSAGHIYSMNTDGSNRKLIAGDCHLPDGIAVDAGESSYLLDKYGRAGTSR